NAMARIYEQAAEGSLAAYRKSVAAGNPDLGALKLSREQAAVAEQFVPGYAQLLAARQHCDELVTIDPQYAATNSLRAEILGETRKVDAAVQSAEALVAAKRYDDALNAVASYRQFAPEAPRIN